MAKYQGKHCGDSHKKKIIYILLLIVFTVMFIYSSVKIITWYLNNKQNQEIQAELSQMITIDENAEEETDRYKVDFNALKEKNPDTVAWLKVKGTNIEFVVVKANDNNYYLRRNFEKQYNVAGWIFADYRNKFDGTDKNIVIYGHNMLNDAMFGTLTNVIKEDWYNNEENYDVILVTEEGVTSYRVFSTYQIENEDYYITTNFDNDRPFKEFIDTVKGRSVKDYNTEVTEDDSILTLSTCASSNKYRIVLHAVKLEEEKLQLEE